MDEGAQNCGTILDNVQMCVVCNTPIFYFN